MQETMEKTQQMVHRLAAVNEILRRNNSDPGRLIPILQQVQEVYHYLAPDVIRYVATSLDIPVARVYGVATFYAHFSLVPKGTHIIRLCDGTACHVKKSHDLLDRLYERLGLSDEKRTTDDGLFTIELVSCLGACGLAPVMILDDTVHGQATPQRVDELIDEILAAEAAGTEKNQSQNADKENAQ